MTFYPILFYQQGSFSGVTRLLYLSKLWKTDNADECIIQTNILGYIGGVTKMSLVPSERCHHTGGQLLQSVPLQKKYSLGLVRQSSRSCVMGLEGHCKALCPCKQHSSWLPVKLSAFSILPDMPSCSTKTVVNGYIRQRELNIYTSKHQARSFSPCYIFLSEDFPRKSQVQREVKTLRWWPEEN